MKGVLARHLRWSSQVNVYRVFPNIENVQLVVDHFAELIDAVDSCLDAECLLVKTHDLRRTKNDRSAKLQHPAVFKGFEDDLDSDAVDVTDRNSHLYFLLFFHSDSLDFLILNTVSPAGRQMPFPKAGDKFNQ